PEERAPPARSDERRRTRPSRDTRDLRRSIRGAGAEWGADRRRLRRTHLRARVGLGHGADAARRAWQGARGGRARAPTRREPDRGGATATDGDPLLGAEGRRASRLVGREPGGAPARRADAPVSRRSLVDAALGRCLARWPAHRLDSRRRDGFALAARRI